MPTDYYQSLEAEPSKSSESYPDTETETTLVPKSLLGEVEVGDTITIKVEHIYEDEIEVSVSSKESESDEDETEEAESEDEFDMMAKG